jgi:hypothetical protein
MIADDLARAERLTRRKWERRGLLARVGETVSWLFSEGF